VTDLLDRTAIVSQIAQNGGHYACFLIARALLRGMRSFALDP
jgi:hypothetical protein